MCITSNRSTLHRRLSSFVDWIKTDSDREDDIRKQSQEIRDRIRGKAEADGLVIRSTPNAGSFAKRTGLRRHLLGNSTVEGQDVDLPFVISPRTRKDEEIDSLLDRFYGYAHAIYPQTSKSTTRNSIRLEFVGSKLSYDLVPMIATSDSEKQVLLPRDGGRRETSVQKHIEFIKSRTRKSGEMDGRVMFHECIRLFKWWRCIRTGGDEQLVPSMVIDLLCAKAFDAHGVEKTYADTLVKWFGWLAYVVQRRDPIYFSDYTSWTQPPSGSIWSVIDPVNAENNVVSAWKPLQVEQLAGWLADARDQLQQAIAYETVGDHADSLEQLILIFGNPFRHHCGEKE